MANSSRLLKIQIGPLAATAAVAGRTLKRVRMQAE
jgi:hypothetical protein